MFRRIILLLLLICLKILNGFSQVEYDDFYSEKEEKISINDRIFFGGNVGLTLSNHVKYIELSPLIGYNITNSLSVGTGPVFQFYKYYDITLNIFGGRIFSRYLIFRNIFIHAEEQLTVNKYNFSTGKNTNSNSNKLVNDLMLGGGIRLPFSKKGSVNLVILYNFTESDYSLNANPIIRFDFNF